MNPHAVIAASPAPVRRPAVDGGYASRANLAAAKARGVADVAVHKKVGIAGVVHRLEKASIAAVGSDREAGECVCVLGRVLGGL